MLQKMRMLIARVGPQVVPAALTRAQFCLTGIHTGKAQLRLVVRQNSRASTANGLQERNAAKELLTVCKSARYSNIISETQKARTTTPIS